MRTKAFSTVSGGFNLEEVSLHGQKLDANNANCDASKDSEELIAIVEFFLIQNDQPRQNPKDHKACLVNGDNLKLVVELHC